MIKIKLYIYPNIYASYAQDPGVNRMNFLRMSPFFYLLFPDSWNCSLIYCFVTIYDREFFSPITWRQRWQIAWSGESFHGGYAILADNVKWKHKETRYANENGDFSTWASGTRLSVQMGKIEYLLVGFCSLHQEKDVHRMIPFGSSGQKSVVALARGKAT